MVKMNKTRKGFTLVEMVLVVAIIIIMAVVVWVSVSDFIFKAHEAKSEIIEHKAIVESATAEISF